MSLLAPIRGRLALAVVLQAIGAAASVLPFIAVAELGRILIGDKQDAWPVIIIGAAALLLRFMCFAAAGSLTHLADNDLTLHLRRRLTERLGRLPLGWFTERSSGLIRKSIQDDVSAMHHLVGHTITDLTAAIVAPLTALAYLFAVDWRLTLLTLVPLVAGLACFALAMSRAMPEYAEYDRALARVSSATVEFVQGISVVKAFGQTGKAHRKYTAAADDFATFFLAWVKGMFRLSATMELLLSPVFMLGWILGAGTIFVTAGWVPPVDVLPFALLGLGLTAPVQTLGYAEDDIRTARQAAARVSELLDAPPLPQPQSPREPDGTHVEFDHVSYSYDERVNAVTDVTLDLPPGSLTALVGASGSGKTTLARLLPRFFDVTGGAVRIGGVDVREMSADRLYQLVSFVFQDVQLLRASVRDNIALARPDATDAEVSAVARAARIHDRITELPLGYDSVIGSVNSADVRLSGGEAQRVSIARALLADAPILVLDEATAFADPESEAAIQDALSELVAGRTLLVIAHRLATITGADRILVLDGGRVVEQGHHAELIAAGGPYASSWAAYERTTTTPAGAAR